MEAIWKEPARGGYGAPWMLALPGLERLQSWLREGLATPPPLFHLTGARPTAVGKGTADSEMPASEWLLNSAGLINGGTLAILADIAFGCSIETELAAATPYTTAEISLTFLRPAKTGGRLTAHGQVIHVGRSTALSEAFVIDSDERLIAHGTSRCAILPKIDQNLPDPPVAGAVAGSPVHETPDPYLRTPPTDGVLEQAVWESTSGADILRRQIAGELPPPPVGLLTGVRPTASGEGSAEARMPASEWLASPSGLLQGGTIAMLADVAMLSAVQTTVPAGTAFAGLDLKINYLRPAPPDGRDLIARAEVIHSGRTIAVARTTIENADGKAVALATGSMMFLPGRPADLGEVELSSGESA